MRGAAVKGRTFGGDPARQASANRLWPRVLRRHLGCRRGVVAVEFALIGVAMVVFIFAILELGMLGFSLDSLTRGVQAAARTAVMTAANAYATNGAISCPTNSTIIGYFNGYASPPLPAATGSTSNPAITATWTNNSSGTVTTEPEGVYLTLTGTYTWVPMGYAAFGHAGIKLNITSVAIVPGSSAEAASC
jgi:Flp pilus assembly protein TadG